MASQGDGHAKVVRINIRWGPQGAVIIVGENPPIVIPFQESLRMALEAHGWLISQMAGFLLGTKKHPLL